jgi:hypothetical protein
MLRHVVPLLAGDRADEHSGPHATVAGCSALLNYVFFVRTFDLGTALIQALSVILIRPILKRQRPQLGGAEAVLFGAVALMRPALIINLRRNAKSFKLIRSRNAHHQRWSGNHQRV